METIIHVDLVVANVARSIQFYSRHFDCTIVEDTMLHGHVARITSGGRSDAMRMVMLKLSELGTMIELLEIVEPRDVRQRLWSKVSRAAQDLSEVGPCIRNLAILVKDLDAKVASFVAAGVTPLCPIEEVRLPRLGPARISYVRDPDGNLIERVAPAVDDDGLTSRQR